jgi:hypothetical protein
MMPPARNPAQGRSPSQVHEQVAITLADRAARPVARTMETARQRAHEFAHRVHLGRGPEIGL